MDSEEKKRLKELSDLEERYGHIAEDFEEEDEEEGTREQMPMQGASLRDIDRIREKRRERSKK